MVKFNSETIIEQLTAQGLSHRSLQVFTEGDYLPTDADWNNKDVPHLNHVHRWANDVTCVIEKDVQSTISLQKVLGITCPVVITHYDAQPDHQAHFFTLLAWTFVTDIEFVTVTPTRTRVVTTYTVMGNRFAMLFFPIIAALMRRNNRQLMSEDVPLRERKGRLRSWGYTFRGDGAPRDIRDSLPVRANNVLPPDGADLDVPTFDPVPLGAVSEDGWTMVGRTDHYGLKLTRRGSKLIAFARMCPHEGADLDETAMTDECLTCPWHGRDLPPAAVLDLDQTTSQADTEWHHLAIDGDRLTIDVVDRGGAPSDTADTSPSTQT